jgi:hypothetical protein
MDINLLFYDKYSMDTKDTRSLLKNSQQPAFSLLNTMVKLIKCIFIYFNILSKTFKHFQRSFRYSPTIRLIDTF